MVEAGWGACSGLRPRTRIKAKGRRQGPQEKGKELEEEGKGGARDEERRSGSEQIASLSGRCTKGRISAATLTVGRIVGRELIVQVGTNVT